MLPNANRMIRVQRDLLSESWLYRRSGAARARIIRSRTILLATRLVYIETKGST